MSATSLDSNTQTMKIDLSHHADKFCVDSKELCITKKVNFIFGFIEVVIA